MSGRTRADSTPARATEPGRSARARAAGGWRDPGDLCDLDDPQETPLPAAEPLVSVQVMGLLGSLSASMTGEGLVWRRWFGVHW